MKVFWKGGTFRKLRYGANLAGVTDRGKRPDRIEFELSEVLQYATPVGIARMGEYLLKHLIPAVYGQDKIAVRVTVMVEGIEAWVEEEDE